MARARGPGQLEPFTRVCPGLGWTGARAVPCQAHWPHCSCPEASLTPEAALTGPESGTQPGPHTPACAGRLGTIQPFHTHSPPARPTAARAGQPRPCPSHRGGLGETGLGGHWQGPRASSTTGPTGPADRAWASAGGRPLAQCAGLRQACSGRRLGTGTGPTGPPSTTHAASEEASARSALGTGTCRPQRSKCDWGPGPPPERRAKIGLAARPGLPTPASAASRGVLPAHSLACGPWGAAEPRGADPPALRLTQPGNWSALTLPRPPAGLPRAGPAPTLSGVAREAGGMASPGQCPQQPRASRGGRHGEAPCRGPPVRPARGSRRKGGPRPPLLSNSTLGTRPQPRRQTTVPAQGARARGGAGTPGARATRPGNPHPLQQQDSGKPAVQRAPRPSHQPSSLSVDSGPPSAWAASSARGQPGP